jgi:hypothetical protein
MSKIQLLEKERHDQVIEKALKGDGVQVNQSNNHNSIASGKEEIGNLPTTTATSNKRPLDNLDSVPDEHSAKKQKENDSECIICMSNQKNILLMPCK